MVRRTGTGTFELNFQSSSGRYRAGCGEGCNLPQHPPGIACSDTAVGDSFMYLALWSLKGTWWEAEAVPAKCLWDALPGSAKPGALGAWTEMIVALGLKTSLRIGTIALRVMLHEY